MNKPLDLHKKELEEMQFAQKIALKEQIEDTKNITGNVAKLALIGGASAYVGIKLTGFIFGKLTGKKKKNRGNNEPQIVYVQAPQNNTAQTDVSPKSFMKGVQASLLAALFPVVTSFAKKAGMKAVETYSEGLFEKYKYKLKDLFK
ncbi:hypothetical protein [Bernardetia sp. MNP-M8]|uniref:hypothetical protein n=1 Tax=Bernardetia sp. MNP-M8 TaxID=3127470 RepID=UPI0030D26C85